MNHADVQRAVDGRKLADLAALLSQLHIKLDLLPPAPILPDIFDVGTTLDQLLQLAKSYGGNSTTSTTNTSTNQKTPEKNASDVPATHNLPILKLLSRCFILVLQHAPTKIYDVANHHLGLILLEGPQSTDPLTLSTSAELAIVICIDLFKAFPNNLGLLVLFAILQINKILKKDPTTSANLVYLLATVTENAQRVDLDEKMQSKLLKLATKQITLAQVSVQWQSDSKSSETSILLKQNWILVVKNILVLAVGANYEALLSLSASSSSGSRMKPDTLMTQQNIFQTNLLTLNSKLIHYGLSSAAQPIRLATVEFLAHLMINFISTGKFSAVEYLLTELYPLPHTNEWTVLAGKLKEYDLEDEKRAQITSITRDSTQTTSTNTILNLTQVSVVETLILYIQLEQVQNQDYLLTNFTLILEIILSKLGSVSNLNNHVQNSPWLKTLEQFQRVIKYMINECGLTCHELLATYIHQSFDTKSSIEPEIVQLKKRDSSIFKFKKKGKDKEVILKETKPYTNPYQCALLLGILNTLIPLGVKFSTLKGDDKKEQNEDSNEIEEASEIFIDESFVREVLFKLLSSNSAYIRNYALQSLLVYCKFNGVELNQLILKTFKVVSHEFKTEASSVRIHSPENLLNDRSVRLLSYALALAALIRQAEFADLQTATITKVLSFCTQNLKQASHKNFLQHQACWIILSALVKMYDESEFVRLNLSQFLVFWKSLLTLQLVGDDVDVVSNLRVRNFALVCLLNFLEATELTPEVIRQCQLLLSKSYNYLTFLENTYENIGGITQFQVPSQSDHNLSLYSSPFDIPSIVPFDHQMIVNIFYSKKVLFLLYHRISNLLKSDVNSSMVIYLLKLFSDSKIFTRPNGGESTNQKKKKSAPVSINDYFEDSILLNDDYNYSFGVTSLYCEGKLEHLVDLRKSSNGLYYTDPFGEKGNVWYDAMESQLHRQMSESIQYDATYFLLNDYSTLHSEPLGLVTSLVDLSIEIFAKVFPYLASKIQMSLLEQIRTSLFGPQPDVLRLEAVIVNVSVMIRSIAEESKLEKEIVEVLIDILQKLKSKDRKLNELNCETLGRIVTRLPKTQIFDLVGVISASIFSDTDPLSRGRAVLQLAQIYRFSEIGFADIFSIVEQLLVDPNPIVYFYLVRSATIILSRNPDLTSLRTILTKIYNNFLDVSFSYDISSMVLLNTKVLFSSSGEIVSFMRLVVSTLGPMLREELELVRGQLKDLIICLREGINCNTVKDSFGATEGILLMFQELVIFDPQLIEATRNEEKIGISWFMRYLQFVSSKNMKIGIEVASPTSRFNDALFPFNSSSNLYKLSYKCFSEIVKIRGGSILDNEAISLLWVSMNFKPCEELKELIRFWLAERYDAALFNSLTSLFRYLSKRLTAPFIEKNYLRKLLPLAQRQKKRDVTNNVFKDEESESIVQSEGSEKNEPITWEFRMFIFDLLLELLNHASRDGSLRNSLLPKIQDIVNVSFLGLTSSVPEVRMQGIKLLDKALEIFGDIPDPLYPSSSVLEQQQAQIISALMPSFSSHSEAKIIIETIGVLLRFVNLPRIKFYLKQRILRTLIDLLEELALNKFLRFSYIENMSELNKKAIQLSILNCWAIVKINSMNSDDPEITTTLRKYSKLLNSLWILVLREYMSMKYDEGSSTKRELENYSDYWINFISVLSLELASDDPQEEEEIKSVLGDEAGNFFFVLFSQCVEGLVKNHNVNDILITLKRLMKSKQLVTQVFDNEIFGEVIDIFDRLVLIDDENTETKSLVVEIVGQIFDLYVKEKSEESKMEELDKLFELIRICVLPIFHILPNLKSDYDPSNKEYQFVLKHADDATNLVLLKKSFGCVVKMMSQFPNVVKADIYACILFMTVKVYELQNSLLILTVLPYLKEIISEVSTFDVELVNPFSQLIRPYCVISSENINSIFTVVVLVTAGNVKIVEEDAEAIVDALLEMMSTSNSSTAVQCIKLLIQKQPKSNISKRLIEKLVNRLVGEEDSDEKIALEILVYFGQQITDGRGKFYQLMIPLLLFLSARGSSDAQFVKEKVTSLAANDPQTFKQVLNELLTAEQRSHIQSLVKGKTEIQEAAAPQIQLKTFGAE